MHLFRADGPIYAFISRFTDMVLLSLCWIICSIPIVTVGASTAALYAVCFKMLKNEEGHICRQFFSYFKSNFKQATLAWLILLPIGIIIAYMVYLYYFGMSVMDGAADFLAMLVLVAAALYIITLTYVFACAARYENTPVQTVKNGIFIGLKFIGRTAILLAVTIAIMFVALWNLTTMFIGVLLVPACLTYVHGSFIIRIFEKLEEERAERECREETERHKALVETEKTEKNEKSG